MIKRLLVSLLCFWSCSLVADTSEQYKLDAGDKIQITVFGEADLSLQTRLGQEGLINYPYLGPIRASGLTVAELEQEITQGLKGDYLINPSVNISVLEYRPFYIHGEVKAPGSYPYQPDLTLDKAVALAGGATERAAMSKVVITRILNGKESKLKGNLQTRVQPGDSIFIDESFF